MEKKENVAAIQRSLLNSVNLSYKTVLKLAGVQPIHNQFITVGIQTNIKEVGGGKQGALPGKQRCDYNSK